MRIAISGYVGPKKTGIGVVTEEFLSRLFASNPDGYDYFIFVNKDTELEFERNEHVHLIPYSISRASALRNLLWNLIIFPLQCRKLKINLAIIPNVTFLVFKSCPTVVIIHDLIEFKVPKKFGRARMMYRRIAVPITAHRADSIVTDSVSSRQDIVNDFGIAERKVAVIYPGVRRLPSLQQERDPNEILAQLAIPGDYMLYVGTVDHPGKNGMALLMVYDCLPSELRQKLYVVFAGRPGPGFEKIQAEVERAGVQERVRFLGYVPDDLLPILYANCKVFLFPSRYEGFGLPVIEAMQYGAPVITARNSSLIEAAGDAAMLFDADDVQGMADAVERICRDRDLREGMVQRGKKHISQFSWERNCMQWQTLLASWESSQS